MIESRIWVSARATAPSTTDQFGDSRAPNNSGSSVAIAFFSQEKCFAAPFEDIFDLLFAFIHTADLFQNGVLPVGGEDEDALRLSQNRDVRVMGHKDDLASAFDRLECSHDGLEDEGVIEVVFRLIDQERALTLGQQDGEDGGASLAGREMRGLFESRSIEEFDGRPVL